ncbi:MAG: DNA alkylation repair protein [Myxococcales bacterium]
MGATADEIRSKLEALADPRVAEVSLRFFKTGPGEYGEGDRFRGIRVPLLRKLRAEYRDLPVADMIELLVSPFHEDRLLALLLLMHRYWRVDEQGQGEIYEIYLSHTAWINNWDLVDVSAEHIVGSFLRDKERTPLYQLAASRDLWERRIAIMATFRYIKRGEFGPTLALAAMLLDDKEELIHKAVGWMLRETGKRNMDTEERFLRQHYRKMPRTMLRYAIERFQEERRQQYLKGLL